MKSIKYLIILSVLLNACSKKEMHPIEEIPVLKNFTLETKSIKNASFEEFFIIDQIQLLKFDEYISSFDKSMSTSTHIYAIDKYKRNALYQIDKESGITIPIGQEGDGPGEYSDMVDFDVIEGENKLIIADNDGGFIKLLFYTLAGVFVEERVFEGVTADFFAVLNDGNILFHTEGQCYEEKCNDFVVTDQAGVILSQYSATPAILSEWWVATRKPLFRTIDGKIIATSFSGKSVYIFDSATEVSKYELGEDDQFITTNFLDELDIEDDLIAKTTESFKLHSLENPILIDQFLMVSLEYRGSYLTAICNLSDGSYHLINSFSGELFNLNNIFKIIGVDESKIMMLLDSEHLLANNEMEDIEKKLGVNSSQLDQPIIFTVKLNNTK